MARFLDICSRRKRTVAGFIILVMLTVVAGNCLVTPQYRAYSKVVMANRQEMAGNTLLGVDAAASVLSANSNVNIAKIVAAPSVYVDEVVSKLQLRDGQGRLMTEDDMVNPPLVARLGNLFSADPYVCLERSSETDILTIVSISPEPRQAMMIANCMAEVILDKTRMDINRTFAGVQETISSQLQSIRENYTSNLRAVAEFQKAQESVDVKTEAELAAKKMGQLLKQKEDAHIALAEAHTQLQQLKKHMDEEKQETLAFSALKENPHINAIKEKLTTLRLKLAEAATDFTEEHPHMEALRDQIHTAEQELQREVALYRSGAPEIAELEGEILALGARMETIDENIARHSRFLGDLPDKAFKQASFDIELQASPGAYSALLDSRHAVRMAEVGCLARLGIVEEAKIPTVPFFPNKVLNTILGAVLGLIFGLAIALVREYLDDTIKSADDVKALKPAANIGSIPLVETRNLALISSKDPNDPLYESYRWIRSHFELIDHIRSKRLQSLLIFSPGPNEGKSTTVVNLGISVAREGRKVVLVDTDLRRPSLHDYLHVSNETGLSDWLQGRCGLDEIIQMTSIRDLSVIPSGRPAADPGRLLEMEKIGHLVSKLQTKHDLVILDSAPLLIKADALALARWVQGTVVVLETEKTTRRALCDMMERVAAIPAKPLGFVLNKCPIRRGIYASERYYSYACIGATDAKSRVRTPQEEVVEL